MNPANLMKLLFRHFAVLSFVIIQALAATALGKAGGMDAGGGGDPLANEFVEHAKIVLQAQQALTIDMGISSDQLNETITKIEFSLEGKSPLVIFPVGYTVDCFGAPKPGCVKAGKIHIARNTWEQKKLDKNLEVVVMELMKFMNAKGRYPVGAAVARVLQYANESGASLILQKAPTEIRPLFNVCNLESINEVLSIETVQGELLQFDLNRNDGFLNLGSTIIRGSGNQLKYIFNVSSIYTSETPKMAFYFDASKLPQGTRLEFQHRRVEAGTRMAVYTIDQERTSLSDEAISNDLQDTQRECTFTLENSALKMTHFLRQAGSTSKESETLFKQRLNSQEVAIRPFPPTPETYFHYERGASPVFNSCTRIALNLALKKATSDKIFSEMVQMNRPGTRRRSFQILSAFKFKRDQSSSTETYLINLQQSSGNFALPYSYFFEMKAQPNGDCTVMDVKSR